MATLEERLDRMQTAPQTRKRGQIPMEEVRLAQQYQKQFVHISIPFDTNTIMDCSESLAQMRSAKREARELREMMWEDHLTATVAGTQKQQAAADAKRLAQQTAMLTQLKTDTDKWLMAIELRLHTFLNAILGAYDTECRAAFFTRINPATGHTPLHRACKTHDKELVELLVALGADLTVKDDAGKTIFHLLAEHNQTELFTTLLLHLTDATEYIIMELDHSGRSLLHVAAANGSDAMLTLLLAQCRFAAQLQALVNLQTTNSDHDTALHLAAKQGHTACVRVLLEQGGVNASLCNGRGANALHLALLQTFNIDALVGVFLDKCSREGDNAIFHSLDGQTGRNCLHTAILKNFQVVSLALVRGKRVQLNIATRDGGWSPLHLAVITEAADIVKELLAAESMLDMVDNDGQTPLLQACLGGNLDLVRLLLHAGANPAHQNKQAHSALHYLAAFCRDRQLLMDLIARGADVNAKSLKLNTPLHFAAMNGNDVAAHVLLAHGASASAINEDKRSVVYLAKKWRHRVVEELVKPPEETTAGGGADPHGLRIASANANVKHPPSSSSSMPGRSAFAHQLQGMLHSKPKTPLLTTRSENSDLDSHYDFDEDDEDILPPSTPWPVEMPSTIQSDETLCTAPSNSNNNKNTQSATAPSRCKSFSELREKFMQLAMTPHSNRTTLSPVETLTPAKKHQMDALIASTDVLHELPSRMHMTRFTRKFLAIPVQIPWEMTVPVPAVTATQALDTPSPIVGTAPLLQRKLKPCIRTNIGLFRDHLAHAQQLNWPQHAHHRASRTSSLKYQAPPPKISW
uniref:Uncharacterized protein n=1 Tax=Globisporangium ultimum (strain ATCC 200006 / CBS 805.95 / DAOM BR144) TaxID=431595 RepID=K3X0Y8_GLOUD